MSYNAPLLAALGLVLLCQACSGVAGEDAAGKGWVEPGNGAAALVSYEEYREAARLAAGHEPGFLVETDMYFPTEAQLIDYYESVYVNPVDKSIINLVGGVRDKRSGPTNIRYCFSAGWGQNQGTYTAPALAGVRTSLQAAMSAWQAVADVRFTYLSNLDGATCATSGANPGVDFVVQHWSDPTVAQGPFPSNPWLNQQVLIPTAGIGRLLAIHEIGHTLGFRHEHIHSEASPQCDEGDENFEELTEFDTSSCMKYSDCTDGPFINMTEISHLDGVGARKVYGAPDWWWPAQTTWRL